MFCCTFRISFAFTTKLSKHTLDVASALSSQIKGTVSVKQVLTVVASSKEISLLKTIKLPYYDRAMLGSYE